MCDICSLLFAYQRVKIKIKKNNICKSVCVKVENLIAVACSGVISVPTAR